KKKYGDAPSPDNIVVQGRLENGAVVNAYCGVQPYHGSGHRFEIYGREGTLWMIGGGEGGGERRRKLMGGQKDDKALQELPVPDRFTWVPEAVRNDGPAYDVGQMWVKFAEGIRSGSDREHDLPVLRPRSAPAPNVGCHRARFTDRATAKDFSVGNGAEAGANRSSRSPAPIKKETKARRSCSLSLVYF